MPTSTAPQLGYGQRAEAPIDAVNQYMRSQPWYQQLIRSFGQDPSDVHLDDSQKQQVIRAAQANGIIVDEGHNGQEVDDSGNFHAKSHALRNTLIVAGIAAAALATAGAAGVFGGAAAGGGSAASGAAGAGSLAGVEGGAYGLGDAALASLGGGAGAAGAGAGAAGAASAGAWDAAGNFIGPSTVSSVIPVAKGASTLGSDLLRYALPTAGGVIGGIIQANAAGNASEAQQRYLEEALAYEKEKDKGNIEREAGRYGDYRGNIAPYLATGQAANSRMASLLGLSPSANPYGGPVYQPTAPSAPLPQPPPTTNDPTNPYGKPVGGFDPNVDHIQTQPAGRTTAPPQTQTVPMVGPDGSQQNVPANQVEYWKSKGAQLMGAVA